MLQSTFLCLALSAPISAPLPFQQGTWELSGSAALSAGNGTTFTATGAPGYFMTPEQELGGEVGLGLGNNVTTLSLAPYYRYHLDVGSPWFVPYAGGLIGVLYQEIDFGGFRGSDSDTWGFGQAMVGTKLMSGTRWSALVELAVRHYFDRGLDPYMNLSFGLSVYL